MNSFHSPLNKVAISAIGMTPTPSNSRPIIAAHTPQICRVTINPDSHNCKPKRYDEYIITVPENLLAFLKKESGIRIIKSIKKTTN